MGNKKKTPKVLGEHVERGVGRAMTFVSFAAVVLLGVGVVVLVMYLLMRRWL